MQQPGSWRPPIVSAAILASCAVVAVLAQQREPDRLIGFTAAASRPERMAEARFMSSVSPEAMSAFHRSITRRPHVAGSPGSMEVAETVRKAFADAGLETEVREYFPLLSTLRSIAVEITAPVRDVLSVSEPASEIDPDSNHPELGPAFVAYSASGAVTAPVVYVNYGLPLDYAQLEAARVDVKGRIVIARYARSHRAVKIHAAQERGAAGIIIYSDPADDGFSRGLAWPEGPWRAGFQNQRGNGKYSWFWHGDPLSPGYASTRDANMMEAASAPTLPRIPAVVLAWREAEKILRRLEGPRVPEGFQGGLPFIYRLGPGPAEIKLDVQMDAGRQPIRNVIARLTGRDPDRWVMLGTHHDAWSFGGMDPGSGLTAVFEVARNLAALKRTGWIPARTIVFTVWDAEEFGLVGSTEYAEDMARELREKAVLYVNTDLYMQGRFDGGGTPSLRDFVVQIARDVPDFRGSGSVYEGWRADQWRRAPAERQRMGEVRFEVELAALGSGADFVAFQDHLGLPTLQLEFDFAGSYGTYHSNYDTRWFVERLSDPGFAVGRTLARMLGLSLMRFAQAPILPFRYEHYGRKLIEFLDAAATWSMVEGRAVVTLNLKTTRQLAVKIADRAAALDREIEAKLASGSLDERQVRTLNERLVRLEQDLLDESEPADKRWYRHVIYGWNIYSLYEGQPLPGLAEAIRLRDQSKVAREIARIESALTRMLAGLSQ
jgi:N-acetylated-alpha-linked acidic dipeptidase